MKYAKLIKWGALVFGLWLVWRAVLRVFPSAVAKSSTIPGPGDSGRLFAINPPPPIPLIGDEALKPRLDGFVVMKSYGQPSVGDGASYVTPQGEVQTPDLTSWRWANVSKDGQTQTVNADALDNYRRDGWTVLSTWGYGGVA